ncbi:hypothetical protein MCEMSEM23_02528 [Rhabdaerophilaceae bacterium]
MDVLADPLRVLTPCVSSVQVMQATRELAMAKMTEIDRDVPFSSKFVH